MKVLLTGGTGFIGRHLAAKLSSRGHSVTCLVRSMEKASWMNDLPGLLPVTGDIEDPKKLSSLVKNSELVFHLAGVTKGVDRSEYFRINGQGTENLATAVAEEGKEVKRFIYVSSLAAAGPRTRDHPSREDEEPAPITYYGESKLLGEEHLSRILEKTPWTIIRPPVVYGPYDRDLFLYFKLAHRGFVPLIGKGRGQLSIIHVEDLTEGLILAGFREDGGQELYNISDGGVFTQEEIGEELLNAAGGGKKIFIPLSLVKMGGGVGDMAVKIRRRGGIVNSQKVKEALQSGWVCDSTRITTELGFVPKIDLRSGFMSTYQWYRSAGWFSR